ncbi:MAG TPA: c-type cytochrome domain-containing protein [Anaerolineales bacterium]|nr:c-type cytochrome domain-containing protein [Anaerolineales bacterium]
MSEAGTPPQPSPTTIARFDLSQRIEHAVFLIAFSTLGITGLAQKFATSGAGELILRVLGGIESTRLIHRSASIVLMVVAIYHLIGVLYRVVVRRSRLSILPVPEDFRHLLQDVLVYLGRRRRKAYYARYSYAEKVEYLAVVWGTVIMAVTGFMMWNPIATARALPGQAIPAAKAAHGWEAILAVLAIVIWHFYHVHLRHLNLSMLTGRLTREEMEHEHPAELAEIVSGRAPAPPSTAEARRRMQIFVPAAVVLTAALSYGLIRFVTLEETAILTLPPGEAGPAFVPQTPTPAPTPSPAPPLPEAQSQTWDGGIGAVFAGRCTMCHGSGGLGGLDLSSYAAAMQGGLSGAVILPGEPETSLLILRQVAGNHPGQLTPDELTQIRLWIDAGAPEK